MEETAEQRRDRIFWGNLKSVWTAVSHLKRKGWFPAVLYSYDDVQSMALLAGLQAAAMCRECGTVQTGYWMYLKTKYLLREQIQHNSRYRSYRHRALEPLGMIEGRLSLDESTERFEDSSHIHPRQEPEQENGILWREIQELLPGRLRAVIVLRYQEEWTFREIGRELGINESRAHQLCNQARKRLRDCLTLK